MYLNTWQAIFMPEAEEHSKLDTLNKNTQKTAKGYIKRGFDKIHSTGECAVLFFRMSRGKTRNSITPHQKQGNVRTTAKEIHQIFPERRKLKYGREGIKHR